MASPGRSFLDLYAQGFARVAVGVPPLRLADPAGNARELARLHLEATRRGAAVVLFPELSLSGYSIDDLHQQDALLDAVLEGLDALASASAESSALLLVGAPLRVGQRLYNCAVALSRGEALGVVPKSYLPAYREFYEKRQFAAARDALEDGATLLGREVPFGVDLVFRDAARPDLAVGVELCEDLWAPIPPSTYAAFRGATVLANLSASNVTIGKADYRRQLARSQSAKTLSAYLYSAAGPGESTTDLAWDGHALVCEDGELLSEARRFGGDELVYADIDLDRLVQERARMTSFVDCAADHRSAATRRRLVPFAFEPPREPVRLERSVERFPYVPADPARRDERCFEAYHIQVEGLAQRLRASHTEKVVIGVSGGLDSTQALLVCVRAMDHLGLPRSNVLAYTMPGFATSQGTRANAHALMRALGVSAGEIDIRPSCERMLADIDHPSSRGEPVHDVTFENVQAGERTSHLFRLANLHAGLVVGTGDLSELALGWCTYGVGDHMSHYGVNVSVPKTLVRHLIAWVAEREADPATADVLRRVLATPISPELVPGEDDDGPHQRTEEQIGPYELHDFFLYYTSRRGYRPAKVAYLATHAWARDLPGAERPAAPYACEQVLRWQRVFLERFFALSQFKRSAVPNGPKVGSGGSLSPRGDWRAPSDASAAPWLAALDAAAAWLARSR
jgi:NAD+ synthase (glutamine-hydrolysing)